VSGCEAPGCGRALPKGRRRFCSDLCRVRGQRAERTRDGGEYALGVLRQVRTVGRRAAGDLAEFAVLWRVRAEADAACVTAVDGLRTSGHTWDAVAASAGLSRQALIQWRARRPADSDRNETFLPPEESTRA
jgi:hypothetical protein